MAPKGTKDTYLAMDHDPDKDEKCGKCEPPIFSCRRHRRSPSFLYSSTPERQQIQNDCCTAVNRTVRRNVQPGKFIASLLIYFLPTNIQDALKRRMSEPEPTQRTMTLKRRVGYGEYVDAEKSEQMEVDKPAERRQKID